MYELSLGFVLFLDVPSRHGLKPSNFPIHHEDEVDRKDGSNGINSHHLLLLLSALEMHSLFQYLSTS